MRNSRLYTRSSRQNNIYMITPIKYPNGADPNCRLCTLTEETVDHIVSACISMLYNC